MMTRYFCTGVLAAVGFFGENARAQDALGSGNALDNNLGVGTGGINQPTAAPNYRDRNLLITRDVIGGREFRDAVGYRAEGDFTDALGSNSLFRFRADSAISSPQLFQLGNTYEQLRFGQSLGIVEYRRTASAAPASVIARDPMVISDPGMLRNVDRQTLVNSLAFTEQQTVEPRIIGSAYSRDGSLLYFNASTVRGIVTEPANRSASLIGLSTYDTARIISDAISNQSNIEIGNPFTTNFDQMNMPGTGQGPGPQGPGTQGIDSQQQPAAPPPTGQVAGAQRVDRAVASQHQNILDRVVERYASAATVGEPAKSPELLRDLDKSYKQLRDQLTSRTANAATASSQVQQTKPGWQTSPSSEAQPGTTAASTTTSRSTTEQKPPIPPETPVRGLEHLSRPAAPDGTAATTPTSPVMPPSADVDTGAATRAERERVLARPELMGALRHGLRVDQLSTTMQDRFNELVTSAEKSLSEGEYFLAERRFERALRLVPGHPMASVGMAHAQLGAGLYLSASLTMRTLLAEQPEMIDVTYAPHLLPTSDRMKAAVEAVRQRMKGETPPRDRASYAFLLAYIGHQTSDEALIREGVAGMSEVDPQNTLLPLLEQIWLAAGNAPSVPPASPAPSPTPEK